MSELRALPRSFFDRDPRLVAQELLGKLLVRRGRVALVGRIVETEAYLGAGDAAAHAAAGRTARNAVLWGPPGRAYVYFIYGNYYCLNVSCLPEGEAGCVLIRALEPISGLPTMARNRGLDLDGLDTPARRRLLATGPGRLCQAFGITRTRDNACELCRTALGLYLADDSFRPSRMVRTTRVGLAKAATQKLRYVVVGNAFVSSPRP